MQGIILIVHVLACIGIVVLVLLQHGKGADAGAAFGSGASGTVFGSSGSASFLFKITVFLAVLFFMTSLLLAHLSTLKGRTPGGSILPTSPVHLQIAPVAPVTHKKKIKS